MSIRFTDTERRKKKWFKALSIEARYLYEYLRDTCDIAGFLEIDLKTISFETDLPLNQDEILDTCKTPFRPLVEVLGELKNTYLENGDVIWLKDFLYEQKNLPLNPQSTFHKGIIKIINSHNSFGELCLKEIDKIIIEKGLLKNSEGSFRPLKEVTGNSKGKGNKGVQGENPDHQVCLIDKERAYGNAFTVRSKNGKNLMFNLCPDCKKIYCELVKSEKIHTGKTSLQEIESLIQNQKASR